MYKVVVLTLVQSFLLACGQTSLKVALDRMPELAMSWACVKALVCNWYFLLVGIFFGTSTVLWLYILRTYPLSVSYPLTSFAYIFGMIASLVVFHETIPPARWIGVVLIMIGVFFLTRQ